MLRHECPHVFRGLCCGEAFEEKFQVGLGFDLVGLGGLHQRKEHGAGVQSAYVNADKVEFIDFVSRRFFCYYYILLIQVIRKFAEIIRAYVEVEAAYRQI